MQLMQSLSVSFAACVVMGRSSTERISATFLFNMNQFFAYKVQVGEFRMIFLYNLNQSFAYETQMEKFRLNCEARCPLKQN